ncbi:MAG: PepSY-associated TM helix domain-containing protein [Verrucomicrobiales bacterium]|nr:PepSY-associated TM helix domain-containing protein [Verrucomicrobiales bacterium]
MVGETTPKIHDFPTPEHVKLYYDDASLLVDLTAKTGTYESVSRRPFFYQSNALHRNSLKGWRWASDVFALLLMFVTVSGWFMLKGKNGLGGRGKWLLLAGILPPIAALMLFEYIQK